MIWEIKLWIVAHSGEEKGFVTYVHKLPEFSITRIYSCIICKTFKFFELWSIKDHITKWGLFVTAKHISVTSGHTVSTCVACHMYVHFLHKPVLRTGPGCWSLWHSVPGQAGTQRCVSWAEAPRYWLWGKRSLGYQDNSQSRLAQWGDGTRGPMPSSSLVLQKSPCLPLASVLLRTGSRPGPPRAPDLGRSPGRGPRS